MVDCAAFAFLSARTRWLIRPSLDVDDGIAKMSHMDKSDPPVLL